MLVSVVLELESLAKQSLPPSHGHLVQAALLHSIERQRPDLSFELHHGDRRRPFTVSPVFGPFRTGGGRLRLRKRQEGWLRITSLSEALSAELVNFERLTDQIGLGSAQFAVRRVLSTHAEHRWASRTTFMDLWRRWFEADRQDLSRRIRLQFETPTTFSRGDHELPLPVPQEVFGGLSQKWEQFAESPSPESIAEQFRTHVWLARHDIHTRKVHFTKTRRYVGFQGECEFWVDPAADDTLVRVANLLADFAFYAGVGTKTEAGMGQVRRLPE